MIPVPWLRGWGVLVGCTVSRAHAMPVSRPRAAPEDGTSSRDVWISRFIDEHGDAAYRTAYRLLRDRNDAHDAVQDALTSAFRRWHELRSHEATRGWFFRILVNDCISRQRRRRVRERALQ